MDALYVGCSIRILIAYFNLALVLFNLIYASVTHL